MQAGGVWWQQNECRSRQGGQEARQRDQRRQAAQRAAPAAEVPRYGTVAAAKNCDRATANRQAAAKPISRRSRDEDRGEVAVAGQCARVGWRTDLLHVLVADAGVGRHIEGAHQLHGPELDWICFRHVGTRCAAEHSHGVSEGTITERVENSVACNAAAPLPLSAKRCPVRKEGKTPRSPELPGELTQLPPKSNPANRRCPHTTLLAARGGGEARTWCGGSGGGFCSLASGLEGPEAGVQSVEVQAYK